MSWRGPTIRLTAIYLGIVMAISLFFSINLYRLSGDEIIRSANRQVAFLENAPLLRSLVAPDTIHRLREQALSEGRNRVVTQLAYTNVAILLLGGGLSYYFARRTLKPIEDSHEAQSRFTADASHELRTPLAAMQSEIEVALRNKKLTAAQARELLQSNLEELAKLTQLSEGLLEMAQLESAELSSERLSLTELVQEAINRLAQRAENKKVLIETKITNNIAVMGDKVSLIELIVILLDNAIKYSPDKSTVRIKAEMRDRAVRLSVSDEGPGIAAEHLPHIFERFYRADTARTNGATKGYGLGLSIARHIVEKNHGKIEAISRKGKGTTFIVTLPPAKSR